MNDEIEEKYITMVKDPGRCLAEAAKILDNAYEEAGKDSKEVSDMSALANRWMRLAELSMKLQAS